MSSTSSYVPLGSNIGKTVDDATLPVDDMYGQRDLSDWDDPKAVGVITPLLAYPRSVVSKDRRSLRHEPNKEFIGEVWDPGITVPLHLISS